MNNTKGLWLLWCVILINLAFNLLSIYYPDLIANFPFQLLFNLFFLFLSTWLLIGKYAFRTKQDFQNPPDSSDYKRLHPNDDLYSGNFLIESIPDLLCIKDAKGRWQHASSLYLKMFNLENTAFIGKTDLELSTFTNAKVNALRISAGKDKKVWAEGRTNTEVITSNSSSDQLTFEETRIPLKDKENNNFRLFISGKFVNQSQIADSKIFSSFFFSSNQAFLILDPDFKIIHINESFTRLTGLNETDSVKQNLAILYDYEYPEDFNGTIQNFFQHNPDQLWSGEITCKKKHDTFPAKLMISPIYSKIQTNVVAYYCANILDISQQKIDEKRILKIAHYDDLTGLTNRVMFSDRLSQYLSAAKRHKLHTVVLFLDLDRFKAVNDTLGHQAGDELLKEVAKRLLKQTRKEDVVSRLGGDEFAIMLLNEQSHEKAIFSVSIIAQKIINSLSSKFYIQRQEVFIGASVGIAIFPEDATSVEKLLKHADIAMYEAKKQGRNNFQFFHKKFTSEAQNKRNLEVGLRKALENGEFRLYFQPQYNTVSKEIWGAEVLVRWFQHHTKMIPPDYFIPIAEETGLIIPIGTWILRSACSQLKYWLSEGYNIKQISVNISARQFADPDFIDIIEQTLQDTKLEPHFLELEITESMLVGDIKKIELHLKRLKEKGIKIALDDFGTGYSSLSYLKNFPIDVLKIDQSFIRDMTHDSKDAQIISAIIDMGHSLGQKVVAEGVENAAQLAYLKEKGCDIIQGYYFSPPLPLHEMVKLLRDDL